MITKWGWLWWWWGWWHHSSSESCQRWQPFTSLCLCPTGNSLRWWKIYYRVRDQWSVQCSGVDMGNGLDTWWVIVDESYRSDDEDHDDDNCDVDQFTIHIFVPLSWPNFVWLTHWRSTFEILRGGTILEIQIVDASGVEKPPTTPFMQLTPPPLSFSCFVRSKLILNNHWIKILSCRTLLKSRPSSLLFSPLHFQLVSREGWLEEFPRIASGAGNGEHQVGEMVSSTGYLPSTYYIPTATTSSMVLMKTVYNPMPKGYRPWRKKVAILATNKTAPILTECVDCKVSIFCVHLCIFVHLVLVS